jgi:hypothetical protein
MNTRGLIIIPRFPYPINSGGRLAIYNTLVSISSIYDIDLIIIDDNKKNIILTPKLNNISKNIKFYGHSKYRHIINAFIGLIKGYPLQVGYFYFKKIQHYVDININKYDFVYCFMTRTASYIINHPNKKIHNSIDSMYINYSNSISLTKSLFWKLVYTIEIPLLYRFEKSVVKIFDCNNYVSPNEAFFWSKYGNTYTIPHGISSNNITYNKYDKQFKNTIVFFGRMDYQPNIEAVLWFSKNVLNLLNSDIIFLVIGGFPSKRISNLTQYYNNIKIMGFIEDINIILNSCICTIAPMRSGGGLQTKVIEAMSLGSIVVSTKLSSISILDNIDKFNILIEDDPNEMANLINDIYSNPHNYIDIKQQAKILIKKNYLNEEISKLITNQISNILE